MVRRPLNALLLLDKPSGCSSHAVLQMVKKLFRAEKAGHTGSLDPLATGLLPICFGQATKIAGILLGERKAYEAEILLGTTTDTDDADGTVLQQSAVPSLDQDMLTSVLAKFLGRTQQAAPVFCALKRNGEPLYRLARRGETFDVPVNTVEIYHIALCELEQPRLRIQVTCGAGTYIRSIARDLGQMLGCGAHVTGLRRLWVSPFSQPDMVTIPMIEQAIQAGSADSLLLPLSAGLVHFPSVILEASCARRFCLGQRLQSSSFPLGRVAVFTSDNHPLGLAEVAEDGMLSPKRRFNM